jgi:hypothetical protein
MQRDNENPKLMADPALLQYNPMRTYMFLMPGFSALRYVVTFLILGLPGVVFLITWRGNVPGIEETLSIILLAAIIAGFISRVLMNKVLMHPEELVIRKDHREFHLNYFDIEDAFIVPDAADLDRFPLPDGHFPMEFETRQRDVVLLVLRTNTLSRSSAGIHNGIPTKYVSFNVMKPQRFLGFLRMRI